VAAFNLAMPQVQVEARLLRGRGRRLSRSRLEQLESAGLPPEELAAVVVWLVLGDVEIDNAELAAARRRAMLVLAAGGDPHRELALGDVAVERLASELDAPERRAALAAALDGLAADADGLPSVTATLDSLRADPELAWRTYALALLADEIADDG
jgi:hypothetical protein